MDKYKNKTKIQKPQTKIAGRVKKKNITGCRPGALHVFFVSV